jgi:mediator of RNA polymerase II transcription subunit 31
MPDAAAASADTSDVMSLAELPSNRFELELEFVQSLASPAYLHYLATSGILNQKQFIDFLRYLRYWKQSQYAKYLSYPHCLYFLDLLVPPDDDDDGNDTDNNNAKTTSDSGETFRREMAQVHFRNFVHEQQFYSWQYRSARLYGRGEKQEDEKK